MNITERLNGDLKEYQSIPFWSWNDRLDPERLRKQIRDMKAAGIGGFFMHARGGLTTEYLSDEWFEDVAACIDEAKKQGMNAWAYDENGWPSGFAGMKLLENPENFAHYLTCEARPSFDENALACYRVEEGNLIRVTEDEGESCVCIYDKTNSSVVDILNWKIVRDFIAETHEKYYERFKDDFGKALVGFFTDEPQYFRYRTAYSPVMLKAYADRYGEDLLNELGALFIDCEQRDKLRWRYWKLMNELYTEAFAGQIYRWCEEKGIRLTGHSIEERNLFGQMMCCAGIMPFYEYEHIPGIDWLGREIDTEIAPKQVASASQQLGKKHVITETFACCGWDVTPKELKRIAEWQYVNGVNQMCQHLYPYSIRGQRKRDYPAFYTDHNPWMKEFKSFNDYFTALGYMLAESREIAETVVIHPVHSAYFTFKRDEPDCVKELDRKFASLVETLGAHGIGHHYVDESMLAKMGSVKGHRLAVGKCSYAYVVVPDMRGLDKTTVSLLKEYVAGGGKLYFAGEKVPELVNGEKADIGLTSNIRFEDIKNPGVSLDKHDTAIRMTIRRSDFGDFIYAVNLSKNEREEAKLHVNARGAKKFDLEKRVFAPIVFETLENGGIDIPLTLDAGESIVIFLSSAAKSAEKTACEVTSVIPAPQAFISKMDENALTLDVCSLSYDNKEYTEPLPVMAVSDRLLREKKNGSVYIKYRFEVKAKPAAIRVEAEKMHAAQVWLNGETIELDQPGTQDFTFVSADIANRIKFGTNEIVFLIDYYQSEHVYKVFNGVYYDHDDTTESLVNCLSYETDIEAIYLRGDFCVETAKYEEGAKRTKLTDGPFKITLPRKYVSLNELVEEGFPFFAGTITANVPFEASGNEKLMRLNGRFATARVSVNGGEEKLLMFDNAFDISKDVRKGDNIVSISITNSCRNIYGPFHNPVDPDSFAVSPDSFTLYGTWENGKSKRYTDRYAFTFFGIDEIQLM
ncbi:MAG: hypothetical protein IJC48_11600 [Clostridia bacterium]|nr:hypothetical protein [Clostridia bacterium]